MPFGRRNRWPDSKESCGAYLATIGHDRLGREVRCWEAIGKASTAFRTLEREIKSYIDQTCGQLSEETTWSLYMRGRNEATSDPTVTIISNEPGPRRTVRKLILDSKLLDNYPGFVTMDIDRPPGCRSSVIKTLGELSDEEVTEQMHNVSITFPSTGFMGANLQLAGDSQTTVASGGALFESDGKMFLSTVAHPFNKNWIDRFPEVTPPKDYDFDFDDISDGEEEEDILVNITSGGSITSNSILSDASNCSANESCDVWSNGELVPRNSDPLSIQASKVQPHSLNDRNYHATVRDLQGSDQEEAALPKIETEGGEVADEVTLANYNCEVTAPAISSIGRRRETLDYSLFELPMPVVELILVRAARGEPQYIPKSVPREPRSIEVEVHTAFGTTAGRLLATPSFMRLAKGLPSQQMWTVIMEGTLRKGICGSVVVDPLSGDIFGHIIAGAPEDGFAYMIPFYEILDDLNNQSPTSWKLADTSATSSASRVQSETLQFRSLFSSPPTAIFPHTQLSNEPWGKDHTTTEEASPHVANLPGSTTSNLKSWFEASKVTVEDAHQRSFIPIGQIREYITQDVVRNVLADLSPPVSELNAETILQDYLKVFCILISIRKESSISRFVNLRLTDKYLPIPHYWKGWFEEETFYDAFNEAQWRFCPARFDLGMFQNFEAERILPIISKEKLHDGGTATLYKIELYPEYNSLQGTQAISRSMNDTFVLKTYRNNEDSKRMYENEIAVFDAIRTRGGPDDFTVKCYAAYVQDQTYNLVLEYASGGDLQQFWQSREPPDTGVEMTNWFLQQALGLATGLQNIHKAVQQHDRDHCRHGDLKPQNILCFPSNDGSNSVGTWKISDFSLSHIENTAIEAIDDASWDYVGTKTYSAPECYHPEPAFETLPLTPRVDMWSLGCIYTEFATWLVQGPEGVNRFREKRTKELKSIGFGDTDCFHNGKYALGSVSKHFIELHEHTSDLDPVTREVLDIADSMLQPATQRPDARTVEEELEKLFHRWRGSQSLPNFLPNQPPDAGNDVETSVVLDWVTQKPPISLDTGSGQVEFTKIPPLPYFLIRNPFLSPTINFAAKLRDGQNAKAVRELLGVEPEDGEWIAEKLPSHRLTRSDLDLELRLRFGQHDFNIKHRLDRYHFQIPKALTEIERMEILDSPIRKKYWRDRERLSPLLQFLAA